MDYATGGGVDTTSIIIAIIVYVFMALVLMGIANKTKTKNAWFAWVPILNIFLILMIAKRPLWWFILLLIPIVNFIVFIILWVDICKARGKPGWWVILLFIPIVNIIILAILAWGK